MGTLTSLLVLSFLIFFHELGHFLAARFFGVRVEVFSIGFGKKVFSKIVGNTEYRLSLIPLGGYVQMKGQDDRDPTQLNFDNDSYTMRKPWQRIMILFAGPFANFLLAFLLFIIIALNGITFLAPVIGSVMNDSPAFHAGFVANDKILAINDEPIKTWNDLQKRIQHTKEPLVFNVQREQKVLRLVVTPKLLENKSIFGETVYRPMIGIGSSKEIITLDFSVVESLSYAYSQTITSSLFVLEGLQKLLEGVVPVKDMGGIISIVKVTSDASEIGFLALFSLTALISVNLGVFNLLPIPALDGGHIMFNAYEMLTRRPPSERIVYGLTLGGWMILLTLMAFTIFNDIYRLAGGH